MLVLIKGNVIEKIMMDALVENLSRHVSIGNVVVGRDMISLQVRSEDRNTLTVRIPILFGENGVLAEMLVCSSS